MVLCRRQAYQRVERSILAAVVLVPFATAGNARPDSSSRPSARLTVVSAAKARGSETEATTTTTPTAEPLVEVALPHGLTITAVICCALAALCGKFRHAGEDESWLQAGRERPTGCNFYTICCRGACCNCYEKQFALGKEGVVSFWDWFFHEHTLLSLCFAKEGRVVEVPCFLCCTTCCCIELEPEIFGVRMRAFVFVLVLMVNFHISAEYSGGMHGIFWYLCVTTFVVMPLTCWLKTWVPRLAALARGVHPSAPLAAAIVIVPLVASASYADIRRSEKASQDMVKALKAFILQLYLEFFTLAWKYFCKNLCCPCCVPSQQDVRTMSEVSQGLRQKKEPNVGPQPSPPLERPFLKEEAA